MARNTGSNNNGRAPKHDAKGAGQHKTQSRFSHFAQETSRISGKPITFLLAVAVVLVWAVTGPIFNYSDTWQLVINTGTTVVTFLMVFLIQNTQNRDTLALQLKLSELVLATKNVEDRFATIEDLSDQELEELHKDCRERADHVLNSLNRRREAYIQGTRKEKRRAPAKAG